MWYKIVRRRRRRRTSVTKHYLENKELARKVILARLEYFNQFYGFSWKRVAIRNTKTRWGSCSQDKNLNFNYKLIFLPEELRDYVIVHELCHLKELHHKESFWLLVAEQLPNYKVLKNALAKHEVSLANKFVEI